MRATVATAFGPPDVLQLREVADPRPRSGQALVEVSYSDVGTLDRLVRSGWGSDFFDVTPPYVPGDGVGGVVRAVGDGVDQAWVGRHVVGGTGPRTAGGLSAAPTGGYADLAVIDATALSGVPPEVELETATAVLNDGPTSQLLMDVARLRPDDVVLVLAAAGAAGVLLTQLARSRGATVIAAARGDAKLAAVRALGVDGAVDYGHRSWTAEVMDLSGRPPSVVFDGAGAHLGRQAFDIAARGSRFLTYGSSAGEFAEPARDEAAARSITVTGLFELPTLTPVDRAALVRRAMAAAVEGVARPRITRIPLADAALAHRALEDRTAIGKTLLTHPGSDAR